MKTLLKLTVIAAGLAVTALPAARAADQTPPPAGGTDNPAAQPEHPGWRGRHMDPARRIQRLAEVLGLTTEQQTKLKAVFKEEGAKMRAVFQDSSLSREDRRAKLMELRKDIRPKIDAILTPEQQKKLEKMQRRGRRWRHGGPDNQPPPPPPPPEAPPANPAN